MEETIPNAQPRDARAFNAYRHGLSGQVLVIPPSEQAAYEQHCRGIHQSLDPRGALETDLTQSVADDRWRLKRAAAMESNIFALGLSHPDNALTGNEECDIALAQARIWLERGKDLQLLALYESRIQRRVERNLALLRQLQNDRREALRSAVEEAAKLPETKDIPAAILPAPFVCSRPDFEALVARHRLRNSPPRARAQAA